MKKNTIMLIGILLLIVGVILWYKNKDNSYDDYSSYDDYVHKTYDA